MHCQHNQRCLIPTIQDHFGEGKQIFLANLLFFTTPIRWAANKPNVNSSEPILSRELYELHAIAQLSPALRKRNHM